MLQNGDDNSGNDSGNNGGDNGGNNGGNNSGNNGGNGEGVGWCAKSIKDCQKSRGSYNSAGESNRCCDISAPSNKA